MPDPLNWIDRSANLNSFLGLSVGVIGFAITVWQVIASKKASITAKDAALRAEKAANDARKGLRLQNTIGQMASAISSLSEIKRLQRAIPIEWDSIPDRYDNVCGALRSIEIDEPDIAGLGGVITHLRDLENKAEKAKNKPPLNVATLNAVLTDQIDKLQQILTTIKKQNTSNYGS